jgi:ribonuclease VapC
VEAVPLEPVDSPEVAFQQHGKASSHGARLNVGDCVAHVLIRCRNEPLLFVGDHFATTGVVPAWPRLDPGMAEAPKEEL